MAELGRRLKARCSLAGDERGRVRRRRRESGSGTWAGHRDESSAGGLAVPAEEVDAVVGRMLICGVWWAAGPYQMRPEK